MKKYLSDLNESQKQAVLHNNGPILVLAGAGSGKTRVLTNRIARLIEENICKPEEILSVTFTNKAAKEMVERINNILKNANKITISTFHSFGAKILRTHGNLIGIKKNFIIMDDNQRLSLIKESIRFCGCSSKIKNLDEISLALSIAKNKMMNNDQYLEEYERIPRFNKIYETYKSRSLKYQTIDFDDLILLPFLLFEKYPDILNKYQKQYKYISIDEFQDTNKVQLNLCKLLCDLHNNVFAVGDDDQGIYSWRGADINNILLFEKYFPNCKKIVLDINYRCTNNILNAALCVIDKNTNRTKKNIRSVTFSKDKIVVFKAEDEQDELEWIANTIIQNKNLKNISYSQQAILVRVNTSIKKYEEALRRFKIPYKIYGAMSFFDRKEVKDIFAYLRFFANKKDELSLLRVLKVPNKGLSSHTFEEIERISSLRKITLFEALEIHQELNITLEQHKLCNDFLKFVSKYENMFKKKGLYHTIKEILSECNYFELLKNSSKENNESRIKNVEDILESLLKFEASKVNKSEDLISQYLLEMAIIKSDDVDETTDNNSVKIMTIHKAKGLEFDIVFLSNLDDSVFPSPKAIEEGKIEEERRLFYVGMTRAKKYLYLTYPQTKEYRKNIVKVTPTRFIREIPDNFIDLDFLAATQQQRTDFLNNFFENVYSMFK